MDMVLFYYVFSLFGTVVVFTSASGIVGVHLGVFTLGVILDFYSITFLLLLFLISTQVLVWSYYYMDLETSYRRFLGLVFFFLCAMFSLVLLSTLFGALIGWDGLGITSFLLVIYFKNRKSLGSGLITALTNRLGDCFLLVSLSLHFAHLLDSYVFTVFLLLASMTKSAQFPFSSWLPAAMAAPTPVSALVHSSTLVTAGIYLLIRFNYMGTEWMLVIGSVTMTMAGLCACVEMDLKKIVALSTLSQLGVMVVALSVKLKSLCFFHLSTHAMFKSLLFLSVGMGIHSVYGTQDFRSFAAFSGVSPLPCLTLTIANSSLAGFPFMAGFYSKDAILESFYSMNQSYLLMFVFLVGVGLTSVYSVKMVSLAVLGSSSSGPADLNGGGATWTTKMPLFVLGTGAVCGGVIISMQSLLDSPKISEWDKLAPFVIIAVGFVLGYMISNAKYTFLSNMWYVTPSTQSLSILSTDFSSAGELDRGSLALILPVGSHWLFTILAADLLLPLLCGLMYCVWLTS